MSTNQKDLKWLKTTLSNKKACLSQMYRILLLLEMDKGNGMAGMAGRGGLQGGVAGEVSRKVLVSEQAGRQGF